MATIHGHGEIVHLDDKGVFLVRDQGSQKLFAVPFDLIKGYRGETARELGLRKGRTLDFTRDGDHVRQAELRAG